MSLYLSNLVIIWSLTQDELHIEYLLTLLMIEGAELYIFE